MSKSILATVLALAAYGPGASVPGTGDTMDESTTLIDFGGDDSSKWTVVNDGVMGGVSRSELKPTDRKTGIFSGMLSLENNGGFASVRAAVDHRDLATYAGLEIRVRGDGRTYQLRLRTNDRFDGIAYRTVFATRDGEWLTVRRSFTDFRPTFRGRTPTDAAPLDPAKIHQVGFLLADGRPGAFSLEIDFVRTWVVAPEE